MYEHLWLPSHDSDLYYEAASLVWLISRPHLHVVLSYLLEQVG